MTKCAMVEPDIEVQDSEDVTKATDAEIPKADAMGQTTELESIDSDKSLVPQKHIAEYESCAIEAIKSLEG